MVILQVARNRCPLAQNWSGVKWAEPASEPRLGADWVAWVTAQVQSSDVVRERCPVTEQREAGLADLTPEITSPLDKR